jgi:excisionase family DNA binding protein
MPDPEKLLTASEVAAMLQVSRQFVYEHAIRSEPRIPCIRLGAAVRFRRESIEQFIRALEEESSARGRQGPSASAKGARRRS